MQESEDEDEDDEDDDEEDEEDEEDEDGDIVMLDEILTSPSKRGKKRADEVSVAGSDSTSSSWVMVSEEEAETDTQEAAVDDGMPHPRVRIIYFLPDLRW